MFLPLLPLVVLRILFMQAPKKDDPIRGILDDIGPPPEGSSKATTRGAEISLTLTNKFANVDSMTTFGFLVCSFS